MSFIDLINKKNNRISLYKLDEEILKKHIKTSSLFFIPLSEIKIPSKLFKVLKMLCENFVRYG